MEQTSREEANRTKTFRNVRDRVNTLYEQIKERESKMFAMYVGRINELEEEMQKKDQLVTALTGRTKELEKELEEKDSAIATLKLELARSERDSGIRQELENKDCEEDCHSDKTEVESSQCETMKKLAAVTLMVGAVVAAGWWFRS